MLIPGSRCNRIEQRPTRAATIISIDEFGNAFIAYEEGGNGWWPIDCLEEVTEPVMPPAQNLGQEWASPTGTLYRVAQAFDDVGHFLPDDPATPPRESLRWVVVQPQP